MIKLIYALIGKKTKKNKNKKRREIKKKKYEDDENSYDEYGFNKHGFDRDGYNRGGYDKYGYDKYGYDRDGYNRFGFNIEGYSYSGYDRDGYDKDGYDRDGFNIHGLDRNGYDRQGYNINGENKNSIVYFDLLIEDKEYFHDLNVGGFLRMKKELDNIGEINNISIFYGRYYLGDIPENIFNILLPQINKYDISSFSCSVDDISLCNNKLRINIKVKKTISEEDSDLYIKKIIEHK